jgi:hypothetical protein
MGRLFFAAWKSGGSVPGSLDVTSFRGVGDIFCRLLSGLGYFYGASNLAERGSTALRFTYSVLMNTIGS